MGKSASKIIDLEMSEDGAYASKGSIVPTKKKKPKYNYKNDKQPKYIVNRDADQFLSGIDVGLDFIDNVVPRIERFLKLRG